MDNSDISALRTRFFRVSLYHLALILVSVSILLTAVPVVRLTYEGRMQYHKLAALQDARNSALMEQQQLLLEERTLSGNAEVARRAMLELEMHFPEPQERLNIRAGEH